MSKSSFAFCVAWLSVVAACDDASSDSKETASDAGADGSDDGSVDADAQIHDAGSDAAVDDTFETCFDGIEPSSEEQLLLVATWQTADGDTRIRVGRERSLCDIPMETQTFELVRAAVEGPWGEECITDGEKLEYMSSHHNWSDHMEVEGDLQHYTHRGATEPPDFQTVYELVVGDEEAEPVEFADGYSIPTIQACPR